MHRLAATPLANRKPLFQSMAVAMLIGAALAAPSALAETIIITGLNGTGTNYSSTTPRTDTNWNVAALPAGFTTGTQTPSYPAWVFTGSGGATNIPGGWVGGGGNSGTNGNHWIGLRRENTASLFATGTVGQYYSTIYSTSFYASGTGVATLSFDISVDNRAFVYVGGSITGTNTDQPTITGGQQIGSEIWNFDWQTDPNGNTFPRAFAILQTASGTAFVNQGLNTLYIRVDDVITTGTTFGSTGLLVTNVVPEPSAYAMALAGIAIAGWQLFRRRKTASAAGVDAAAGPTSDDDGAS